MNQTRSPELRTKRTSRGVIRYDAEFEPFALEEFFSAPDQLVDSANVKILKHDQTTSVVTVVAQERELVVKRYNRRDALHAIKRSMRSTRALRCWRFAHRILQLGVRTPRPVLALDIQHGPFKGNAYYVCEFKQGEICLELLPKIDDPIRISDVAHDIMNSVRILKDNRISHGDMKATNLIIDQNKTWFLDLDATRQHRSNVMLRRGLLRDKRRFLKNWRGHPDLLELFNNHYQRLGL